MNHVILGIDEVGRGCWAGPVVAGAVILGRHIADLDDSKKLSAYRRQALATRIHQTAAWVGLGWVSASHLDKIGLTEAVRLAMQRAIEGLNVAYDQLIVDGNYNYLADKEASRALIRADGSIPAVSAASIVAKVARDSYMHEVALKYPQYGFEQHVGYGTALHLKQLQLHGVSEIHRRSFKPVQALLQ